MGKKNEQSLLYIEWQWRMMILMIHMPTRDRKAMAWFSGSIIHIFILDFDNRNISISREINSEQMKCDACFMRYANQNAK